LEPITHLLTGACLGRAGLNRKTALATATLTLAAEATDASLEALADATVRLVGGAAESVERSGAARSPA